MIVGDGNYQDLLDSADLAEIIPSITGKFRITSPNSLSYNCLSWAVGIERKWLDPEKHCVGYWWPEGVEREWNLTTIGKILSMYGFDSECSDSSFEEGFIKVAVYVDSDGEPQHVARQLENGKWTSKLADLNDIEHETLECLEGEDYGKVHPVLRRKVVR